jgi:hypothetical protein
MEIRSSSSYLHFAEIPLFYKTTINIQNVMKKLSLILAAMVLFAGVSFAQDTKTTTTKTDSKTEKKSTTKTEKKGGKKEKKADKAAPATK